MPLPEHTIGTGAEPVRSQELERAPAPTVNPDDDAAGPFEGSAAGHEHVADPGVVPMSVG